MILVCDGSEETDARIGRVLMSDPGLGIVRHADAGYEVAVRTALEKGIKLINPED